MAGKGGWRRQSARLQAMITTPNPSQNQRSGNALSSKRGLRREPAAASRTFANCSSPNSKRPICFSGSAKRIKKVVNDEARPQVATNENEGSEGHSSSQVSPSYQAVLDKLRQSLSPRQTIKGSRIGNGKCEEIPGNAIRNGHPYVNNAVSNEHTSSLEPAITSNLAQEQEARISNHHFVGKKLNRTHSFGLTELVGIWGDNDSDIDEAQSSAYVQVSGYNVKKAFEPIVRSIINKYGDIASNYCMKTPEARSLVLENLSEFIQSFETKKSFDIPQQEIEKAIALVHDFRTAGMDVGWLQLRFTDMLEAKQLLMQSSTLRESRDKNNQVMEKMKKELEVYEPQILALQEKVDLAKKKLAAAQAQAESISEKVSNAKAKVRFFVDHSPFHGLF